MKYWSYALTAAACLGGLTSSPASAADCPMWGGTPARNMASAETNLPEKFVPGKKRPDGSGIDLATTKSVLWTAKLGTENYAGATVAGGRVYIPTNDMTLDDARLHSTGGGMLLCLDEKSGKLLWRYVSPKRETDRDKVSPAFEMMSLGICSPPTVEGDRVYLVNNRCEVVCLDANGLSNGNDGLTDEGRTLAADGEGPVSLGPLDADVVWRFDMIHDAPSFPHDAANSAVLVLGDYLYVGTSNGLNEDNVPLPSAPTLIVLDKRTGKLVARDDGQCSSRVMHGQWSSPAYGRVHGRDLVFYGGGDGFCYAFEPIGEAVPGKVLTLKTAWWFDCNPPEFRFDRNGRRIAYVEGDKRKNAENKDDGEFYSPCEIIATPVFYNNRVFVAIGQDPLHGRGKGVLSCIDASGAGDISRTGKVWTYEFERSLSTVSIHDGLLYVADFAGRLHCLDVETGKLVWMHDTKQDVWASTLVADGKVYLGTRKSLWVFAAGREPKVLAEIPLGSAVRSTPAAASGVLYVASQRYLWAVKR